MLILFLLHDQSFKHFSLNMSSNFQNNGNGKRKLNIDDSNNHNKKRRKLNTLKEEKNDEINDVKIDYNAETTVELANRLNVPTYAHKQVYHNVQWRQYLDIKYDSEKYIKLNGIETKKDAFFLENVLSKNECQTLIFLSESHGYCPLFSALNGKTNRTNTRMIIDDKSLSILLYERIKCYL
eukprot:UN05918